MKSDSKLRNWLKAALCCCGLVTAIGLTGCQVHIGGQTLPSPYYLDDDVQYFAPGPEFKLAEEAAAMQEYAAEQELRDLGVAPSGQ